MPAPVPSFPSSGRVWFWHILAACLILGSSGLHIAYLAHDCPLDLAPDEAHYWDWSRHLDWSYYSKGPLVAYLIRMSVDVVGSWSEHLTGSSMLAVRLPAVACGGLLLLGLYILTMQVYGRPGLAVGVVATALTMPIVAAGSTLMTIDAPFICCWCWALVLGYQAMGRGSQWAWPLAGLVVGFGILAKYTMILWPVSTALFLLTDAGRRRQLLQPGFWIMMAIAAGCCLPIFIWNSQHDWLGVRHLTRLAGLDGSSSHLRWLGPFSFLIQQALLHLGFWFCVWLTAMIVYGPWKRKEWPVASGQWLEKCSVPRGQLQERLVSIPENQPPQKPTTIGHGTQTIGDYPLSTGRCLLATSHWPLTTSHFLWWFSAPVFVVFLLFSFKTGGGEPNWPVAAYISGLVLAAGWLCTRLDSQNRAVRRMTLSGLFITCSIGLALTFLMHHTSWVQPILAHVSGPATASHRLPLRRFDPTCRLRGWRQLAAEVDRLRSELQVEGPDPLLAAGGWTMPGELGFYCHGHPTVYSLGLALADRHSQYDLWRPNPVFDPDHFRGQTVIFVGELSPALEQAFVIVEHPTPVTFFDGDYPLSRWNITICRDFRGFPAPSFGARQPGF
jgi:4-amino-4-deoxy-L-arabinose transferase-like glycosyltransferase